MRHRAHHLKIYKSRWHIFFTLFVLVLPFIFLFFFSQLANIATPFLFYSFFVSVVRLIIAYLIAVILAWLLALLFYRGHRATVALPIFDILQSFPTSAALPLATLVWGVSNFTVIFFLVITIIWPILFSVISSLKLIKKEWVEAAQIANLGGINYLKNFLWPVSVPGLVTGTIIGLGDGWEALVATEIIVGIKSGLGNFFGSYAQNTTITTFGILGLLILIFTINKLIWLPLLEKSHDILEE